ncbi:MAG TPA: hypothetical protein VL551_10335 [Actinospica sp.]|jgi:hypothetical protein|nr:hypothetical protein [Actinospica sp.]
MSLTESNEFMGKPKGPRRAVIAVVVVGVVATAVGYVLGSGGSAARQASGSSNPGASAPHQSGSARPLAPAPAASLGPIRLVQGSLLVNSLYVDFPHSTVGAISAADEYITALGSTLDPDRAATVARLAADPSYTGAQNDAATGTQNTRTSLGLPATGAVPQGYSVEVDAVAYQLKSESADNAEVLLLAYFTEATPSQGTVAHTAVFPMVMHWAAGDWKFLPMDTTDYSALAVQPGSAQAASDGWTNFTQ